MKPENLNKIKKLSIIAMFSDDDLMDTFVLKGGNAIDIVHKIALRSSKDIDFSIENEFSFDEMSNLQEKIENALKSTFHPEGFEIFDVIVSPKPTKVSDDMANFWGGYGVKFKIIESEKYKIHRGNVDGLRRNAEVIDDQQRRTFTIDISKFEFCADKQEADLDGYTIYVYSPEMIIFEKLRAICQQMPEYRNIVKNPSQSARARDFFDIYTVCNASRRDINFKENIELINNIFAAKKVPINLIGKIENYREYHREDFISVESTVNRNVDLKSFDFYFNFVVENCKGLEVFWEK